MQNIRGANRHTGSEASSETSNTKKDKYQPEINYIFDVYLHATIDQLSINMVHILESNKGALFDHLK